MQYTGRSLALTDTSLQNHGAIRLPEDFPDPTPNHRFRLSDDAGPLLRRLFRIALWDIEANIRTTEDGNYFSAGTNFELRVFTRDISYAGVLGLNQLFPNEMKSSLKVSREIRGKLGFTVSHGMAVREIPAPWNELEIDESEFKYTYATNSYTRRTDDVIWLWAAGDLFQVHGGHDDWWWLLETGTRFFDDLYQPFYDQSDGLYRGQPSFVDVVGPGGTPGGYPPEADTSYCVTVKAASTNALYYEGMKVLSRAAETCGRQEEGRRWQESAEQLRDAIRKNLIAGDGTVAYYKSPSGVLSDRRDALGTALSVLLGVLSTEEGHTAMDGYPVTETGIPLFHPFFDNERIYHNKTCWPFVDTFFLKAKEIAERADFAPLNAALLARTVGDGGFREVVDARDGRVFGSDHQLWTAASFVDVCRRAGLQVQQEN